MDGGMTRYRAHLWLAATILTILLIGVVTCHQPAKPERDIPNANKDSVNREQVIPNPLSHSTNKTSRHKPQNSYNTSILNAQHPTAPSPERPPANIYRKDKQLTFNLNTADTLDLMQLYNIGPTFARRIIRYRTLLGGYIDKRQLWEVWGMDSVRYNDIAPHLHVDPADITQIDINSATLDQLKRHPYLDYYQAKAIVQLRETAGSYHEVQDILKIPIIDNETYTHIAPYLSCNSQPSK